MVVLEYAWQDILETILHKVVFRLLVRSRHRLVMMLLRLVLTRPTVDTPYEAHIRFVFPCLRFVLP